MNNNEIKVLLTIELEGGTLVRKGNAEYKYSVAAKNSKKAIKRRGRKEDKVFTFTHNELVAKPCYQKTSIIKEAYDAMTDSNEIPYWAKPKEWKSMSKKQRLESYFIRLMSDIKGKSFTYEVLED